MAGTINVIHTATLLPAVPPHESDKFSVSGVKAVCWSSDKAAVCRPDNVIQLYDEKGGARDKFISRPRDSKNTQGSGYQVTSMVFSPDGFSLAVGQSDGIVFIYRIGDFKGKKSISNKLTQPFSVTAVEWPNEGQLFVGLLDGKIRVSSYPDRKSNNKASLVYDGESPVIRLIGNSTGTELAASFMDGKIVLFSVGDALPTSVKLSLRNSRPATALCIGPEALIAGGSDQKLIIYEKKGGKVKQVFDYGKSGNRSLDMTWAAISSAGNAFVTASSNKLKVYLCNTRTKKWEEGKEKHCPQIYNPTSLALRPDGSYLTVGTCAGSCELFKLIFKRTKSQKMDINYISPSHVVVTNYMTNQRVVLKSKYHNEIIDIKLMGKDRYVIAKTTETMFVCDIEENLISEVLWPETDDSERFYFTPSVCMIFSHGELSLLEYGRDEILGTYRTSVINPRVISVRINERISSHQMLEGSQNKRMAYLLDYKTIQIVDLEYVLTLGSIIHTHKIHWLQLNETGTKLLFKDRRMTLTLVDVSSMEKFVLDRSCGFVQWVPGCDVIVCQSEKQLRIWYNMDDPEISVDHDIRGEATEIVRENEQSVVVIKEGNKFFGVPLDENRIQFSSALELGNLARATYFLEESPLGPDLASLWAKLGRTAALNCDPRIALRAFAAVDDVPKTRFLDALITRTSCGGQMYDEKRFWKSDYWTKANMYLLVGDVKQAVTIFFENDDIDAAIDLYSSLHEFDTVIDLIKSKRHPDEGAIVQDFVAEWYNSDQYELLGGLAERVGKPDVAICFFLEAGFPNKAAPCALQYPSTLRNQELVRALTDSLVQKNFVEDAGNIYEATGQFPKALQCFRRGKFYDKAVNLARRHMQYEVVPLEEEWGDHLMSLKQYDAASNHFIEAGHTLKALEAMIEARQFKKAAQIIETLDTTETIAKYCLKIAEYFKDTKNYSQAEKSFVRGGVPKKAIEMYTELEQWEDAYRIASAIDDESRDELHHEYLEQAKSLQAEGRLGSAEKLLVAIDEVDLAISMYAKAKRYDDVLRLVEDHHPEHTNDTKIHLAEVLAGEENYKGAEMQFIKANHWERAVQMYEGRKMWEDAVRVSFKQVAKSHNGVNAFRQVVFRWSRSLPLESGVKLLNKYGYLEDCIDYNCQQGDFPMAESLAETALPQKLPAVHLAWAQFLEQRDDFVGAKMHYLKANKPGLAIDMLIAASEIQEAIVTAETYAKDELPRVLEMYAKVLFAQGEFNTFESVMLRADKVVEAIEMYKSNSMWAEALKLSKQYVPAMFNQLNEEYAMSYRSVPPRPPPETMTQDPTQVVQQAREFERQGDYHRAIETYLQLTPVNLNDNDFLSQCWVRAAELAKKFLPRSQALHVMKGVAPMLDGIKCYSESATMFYQAGMQKEALNSMIMGEQWSEALRLAREMGPEVEEYVQQKQAEGFINGHKVVAAPMERGEDLGIEAQLDLLCEKNLWKQCLERARTNHELFAKYLAKYITQIVKTRGPQAALEVYANEYGPLIHKLHLNLYRAIASLVINDIEHDDFDTWSKFRDIFYSVCYGLRQAGLDSHAKTFIVMENYMWVMHLLAAKSVFKTFPQLEQLAAKIAMSLLRFIKIVNPERAFYEAGTLCKKVKWESNAFVFFNYYMDIHDAVVAGIRTTADLDQSDFADTDIPRDATLHDRLIVPPKWHENVKDWVLAVSMDSSVQHELTRDERRVFEGSLIAKGEVFEPCVVTGFPVLYNRVTFRTSQRYANKDDWNRFLITYRGQNKDTRLDNIIQFIEKWAGPCPTYT